MESWEKELARALEKESVILDSLTEAAEKKRQALEAGDVVKIDELVNIEQPLAAQLSLAESQRIMLLERENLQHLTLSQIANKAGKDHTETLLSYLSGMKEKAQKLKDANEANGRISRIRLEFYDYLFSRGETRRETNKTVYGNSGQLKKREYVSSGLIDTKA